MKQLRHDLNIFQRFFNVCGYAPKSLSDAGQDLVVFAPKCTILEEVVLILNPLYNDLIEDCFEVLVRAGFVIIQHKNHKWQDENELDKVFGDRFRPEFFHMDNSVPDVMGFLKENDVHVFHLCKMAGDREMRARYEKFTVTFDEIMTMEPYNPPYKTS
jgi:hypothetical protein